LYDITSIRVISTNADLFQSVDITTETLGLNYIKHNILPEHVAATLSGDRPSFTFYRHPTTQLLYFIFHSPDNATVQERMKHTMAIPGLINVHAQDQDVHVDQKIEMHDPDDLVFEAKDERIGKFRSVYLRNKFEGTESTYGNLEADKAFYDKVR
jgi:twinfilin-like protein